MLFERKYVIDVELSLLADLGEPAIFTSMAGTACYRPPQHEGHIHHLNRRQGAQFEQGQHLCHVHQPLSFLFFGRSQCLARILPIQQILEPTANADRQAKTLQVARRVKLEAYGLRHMGMIATLDGTVERFRDPASPKREQGSLEL